MLVSIGQMATMVAQLAGIRPKPAISGPSESHDLRSTEPMQADEDLSSLSSNTTDVFDRNDISPATRKGHWQLADHDKWQRYSSLESATSTAITSMCSSNSAEESQTEQSLTARSSKKRLLNGSVKVQGMREPPSRDSSVQTPSKTVDPVRKYGEPSQKTSKRRGHPPQNTHSPMNSNIKARLDPAISKLQGVVRPRSSIPSSIPTSTFATQCIQAALASRLDPYALHQGEYELLIDSITSSEATVYLNIRNALLRLWIRNPLCSVTREEAAGCAKEGRYFGLAEVAYTWLVRNGYINFGCVEAPRNAKVEARNKKLKKQKTVVVIGAGVAGLTTARQLESLFAQNAQHWHEMGEKAPRVVILEGRKRVGGRVYSKPLRSQVKGSLPGGLRNTAEMGAMIVTGFDRGNPLDVVIRGQLGIRYHMLTDALTIYDCDGKAVNEERDMRNTDLYTDISDRTGEFRAAPQQRQTLKGDEDLINRCRDPIPNGLSTFQLEPLSETFDPRIQRKPISKRGRRINAPPGTEKLTGRSQIVEGGSGGVRAARAAHQMGWRVREGVSKNHTVSLRTIADAYEHPSLGLVMDAAISQYQGLLEFTTQDMRLLNWHHANLEYANAAPVTWLSLSGHDQDNGNEFEGAHSEIVGGYTQLPRGLLNLPTKLDVRFDRVVESIHWDTGHYEDDNIVTKIVCSDGECIVADEVVVTAPLGVLKSDMIDFDPPLPSWKQGAIERMGFGLLNKVILLYDTPFWDDSRDMFGLLNEAEEKDSLDPEHYKARRGRFYLIWNASKISGRPMLIALMAGHAAHQAESTETGILLNEITDRLRKTFHASVPAPREVIVTRWKQDPLSRGTYSFVAPRTRPGDYDLLSRSVGNLHFAGEATCGTHPATVHGAFLSGLRVASEVMDSMAGEIELPVPLVGAPTIPQGTYHPTAARLFSHTTKQSSVAEEPSDSAPLPIKVEEDTAVKPYPAPLSSRKSSGPPSKSVCASDMSFWLSPSLDMTKQDHEACITSAILSQIGDRPIKPARPGVNPFLSFSKAKWEECKAYCSGSSDNSAGRNLIRQTLGQWWKAIDEEEKQPYLEQSKTAQESADKERKEWEERAAKWDETAKKIRTEFTRENPRPSSPGQQ